jgi:hypothetical protein
MRLDTWYVEEMKNAKARHVRNVNIIENDVV